MGNPSACHRQRHNFWRSTPLTRSNGRYMPVPHGTATSTGNPEGLQAIPDSATCAPYPGAT